MKKNSYFNIIYGSSVCGHISSNGIYYDPCQQECMGVHEQS